MLKLTVFLLEQKEMTFLLKLVKKSSDFNASENCLFYRYQQSVER